MTNHLVLRGKVCYFRRKIPVDLQEHFESKQRMFSLETRDYAEAKRLAAIHTVRTDEEFAAARRAKTSAVADNWAEQMEVMPREEAYPEEGEEEWQREYEADPEKFDALARARQQATADANAILNAFGLPTTAQLDSLQVAGGWRLDDLPTPEQAARVTGRTITPIRETVRHIDAPTTGERGKDLRDVIQSWTRRTSSPISSGVMTTT
jgi:hypothetical protein